MYTLGSQLGPLVSRCDGYAFLSSPRTCDILMCTRKLVKETDSEAELAKPEGDQFDVGVQVPHR